jgi:hypothetical protein
MFKFVHTVFRVLQKYLHNGKIQQNRTVNVTLLEQTLRTSHDWAVDRIHILCDKDNIEDAHAIQSEFNEWLNPDIEDHDIYSLEYIGE